ncbi:MAG: hypothetical protein IPP97_26730 [Candidatus Obscuribacter sp.]|nr:hypothetical protein [Candidatus Obscuribacter sp.]
MKIKTLSSPSLAAVACDVLLVGAFEGEVTVDTAVANSGNGSHATAVNLLSGNALARQASVEGFKGAIGETLVHFSDGRTAAPRVVLFGMARAARPTWPLSAVPSPRRSARPRLWARLTSPSPPSTRSRSVALMPAVSAKPLPAMPAWSTTR